MFIVSLNYVKALTEVDKNIESHVAYLEKYYALNKFIVSGRKVPRTGGVILVNAQSLDELNAILAEDPFHQAGVAEYQITEFIPTMTTPEFEQFKAFI